MPKRKRPYYGRKGVDPAKELDLKKTEIVKKLVHARKVLHRALKTARGFERQRLGKRIKLATAKQDVAETGRLQRELNVLKVLDLPIAADSRLHKSILKSKSMVESGLLPGDIKAETTWTNVSPEELSVIGNVTARLYNQKLVKEAISHILGGIYAIIGISDPSFTTRDRSTENDAPSRKRDGEIKTIDHRVGANVRSRNTIAQAKGLGLEEEAINGSPEYPNFNPISDMKSDDLSHGDALVSGSAKEESNTDVDEAVVSLGSSSGSSIRILQQPADASIEGSKSSQSMSSSPKPENFTKIPEQRSSKPESTFLPTLMGGYWSGSESATDVEDMSTQKKKNRPGQQARRALWEKKFGDKANHIKAQASTAGRNKAWDPKRGARGESERRSRRGGARQKSGKQVFVRRKEISTGENAMAIKPRAQDNDKKEDTRPLHPSWEAAKKAKEARQMAAFEGKKLVFQ